MNASASSLIDEHYTHPIAHRLSLRGYDVTAVTSEGLRGTDDASLMEIAAAQERALLTNNIRHLIPLTRQWAEAGRDHYGLLLTSDESMPRSKQTVSRYVDVLAALMDANPAVTGLLNRIIWVK